MLAGIPSRHQWMPSIRMILPRHVAPLGRRQETHSCQQQYQAWWGAQGTPPQAGTASGGTDLRERQWGMAFGWWRVCPGKPHAGRISPSACFILPTLPRSVRQQHSYKEDKVFSCYLPSQTNIPQIILRAFHHIWHKWKAWHPTHQK